jgi:CBS-domain-containing membrane protein
MTSGVSVADVMRHQAVAVREKARFVEIVSAMRRFHISSLPVIDAQDRVIGLISDHDVLLGDRPGAPQDHRRGLLDRLRRHPAGTPGAGRLATELMSAPAVTVTAATPAREAARAMYRHRIHQLPVVDATNGRLTGIVTRSDLLAVYERPDEDIRREILYDIVEGTLGLPPERFDVTVMGGTVTIHGRLERHSAALRLAEAVAHVGGVITVMDHLTYELDDVARGPGARL